MTIEQELSAGDRMTKRRFESMARELAKSNGSPACPDHRKATVVLLEGMEEILDELRKGEARFFRIDAHLASLASTMQRGNDTTQGIAVEAATIEGMILKAMQGRVPVSGGRFMWGSLAIIFPCAAYIFHCLKSIVTGG